MEAQIITTAGGERLVVIPETEYARLVRLADDKADVEAVATFRRKLAAGEEELIPSDIVNRLLEDENRLAVWREHRGLTSKALADKAGIGQGYLSQIETGKREGTIDTLRKLAEALSITLDDLVG